MNASRLEVAVFPLPGFVGFPCQAHELHVFEPRYRKMITDCLDQDLYLGLANGIKQLPDTRPTWSRESKLDKNQLSFQPANVFSIGHVNLLRTLADGRMLIEVRIFQRVELIHFTQVIPYRRAVVERIPRGFITPSSIRQFQTTMKRYSKLMLGNAFETNFRGIDFNSTDEEALEKTIARILEWFRIPSNLTQQLIEEPDLQNIAEKLIAVMRQYLISQGQLKSVTPSRPNATGKGNRGQLLYVDFIRRQVDLYPK